MWKQSFSKVFDDITKENVWGIWRDINNWHQWRTDIQYARLNGPFLPGSNFTLKPKLGPSVKVQLLTVLPHKKFIDSIAFLGGKMYTIHEMEEDPKGLKLITTIEVIGPLAFIWRKLVAKKIANAFPQQTESLVSLCRIQTTVIKNRVTITNQTLQSPIALTENFSFENPSKNPGFLLWQNTLNWQHNIKKGLEPHNISHTQFIIMLIIIWAEKNKRPLTQADICTQSKLDKVTVSKSLKDLEAKNYIKKLDNIRDSRTKLIKLTPNGKILAENLVQSSKHLDTTFFKSVQQEEALFIHIMKKLNANEVDLEVSS